MITSTVYKKTNMHINIVIQSIKKEVYLENTIITEDLMQENYYTRY